MQNKSTSLIHDFFHNKYIKGFLLFDAVIVVAIVGLIIYQNSKTSTISLNIAPIDATISINGDKKYHNGQYSFAPGSYKIEIAHDGLETKTFTVDLKSNTVTSITTFIAGANNNFEFYEHKDNYDSYKKLESIASAEHNITTDNDTSAQNFITKYKQVLSIRDNLPLTGFIYSEPSVSASTGGYSIQSGRDNKKCDKSSCLIVKYYGKDYEDAVIKKIKEAGYDPTDYQIIYERYK